MKKLALFLILATMIACKDGQPDEPGTIRNTGTLQLHPENPHYFMYKGKTLVLISSAEHYGAVINQDFDWVKYLETLAAEGMNYTRIFTGTYFEIPGESFGIRNNTLAPESNKIITPWSIVISDLSGNIRYDLDNWNDAYFKRLKNFISRAEERNIIVEVTLFSSIYRDEHWNISPQNPSNNINIGHPVGRLEAHTPGNGTLFKYQEKFVRKMVNELNEFDNVFFEIQNEPWSDHPVAVYNIVNTEQLRSGDWSYKADFADEHSMLWQADIASVIHDEEQNLPKKHLIAQNYTNFKAPIPAVSDLISIINFHYAWPEAVEWNYHYDRVTGFDESGFAGPEDRVYRRQAWQFILSGGGLFNNLDYSFFTGREDGTGNNTAPGGGSRELRKQLKILSDFIHGTEPEKLTPDRECVRHSPGLIPYILSDRKGTYAIYLRAIGTENTSLELNTVPGNYRIQFLNTLNGTTTVAEKNVSENGCLKIDINIPDGEIALKIEPDQ